MILEGVSRFDKKLVDIRGQILQASVEIFGLEKTLNEFISILKFEKFITENTYMINCFEIVGSLVQM